MKFVRRVLEGGYSLCYNGKSFAQLLPSGRGAAWQAHSFGVRVVGRSNRLAPTIPKPNVLDEKG